MKENTTSWHLHAVFIVFSMTVTPTAIGQKIKKGIIYFDNNPSGKVDGKISAFREADLTFSTMDDTQLLAVQEKRFSLRNPLYKSYLWLAVKFVDTGKEMKIHFPDRCFSEKCILATLEKNGVQFRGVPIANQDEIIAKYDYSEFIHTDTIAKRKEEQALSEKLKSNYTKRTTSSGPKLLPVNDERIVPGSGSAYVIAQGDVVIGKFLATQIPGTFPTTEIDIFEVVTGENSELHAARVFIKESATGPEIDAFTFVDRKWHRIYPSTSALNIEIAKFLIDNRYL